ncbi:MAG: FHA domain-containing protein [Eikenella corrodens]|uniref:FHA domain-containing protein n=1 Tax=Eikenella corrodens TaxID=539 RepID=UPI003610A02E
MKHFWRKLLLLVLLMLPWQAGANQPDVLDAAKSVYRLWIGVPLPAQTASQLVSPQMLSEINDKGYVRIATQNRQILTFFKQNGQIYLFAGHGSGYLVSTEGHIVTNDHVANADVGEMAQLGKPEVFVVRTLAPRLELISTQPIFSDSAKDLSLLQVHGLTGKPLPLAAEKFLQPTLPVFSIGFPGASDDITSGLGFGDPDAYIQPVIAEGTLKREFKNYDNRSYWEHHAPISGGNSGGPLVNRCGQVVGTNEGAHKEQVNTVIAVSNSELVPILQNHNVKFTQIKNECVDSATASTNRQLTLLYSGMGLLILLAAGGGVYLLRLKKQVKDGSNPPINSQLIRRIVGAQQAQAAQAGVSGSVTLTALCGGGNIVLQAGKPVIIGRSAPASVIINQAQVSACHAQLLFDGRQVRVEDLGSTNGTYVNGSKVTRAVLNAGDVLQLTADENIARFSMGSPQAAQACIAATLQPLGAGLPAIALYSGQTVRIGRNSSNDVVINRQQVSGSHCRISVDAAGNVVLEDLQSTNGTFVDSLEQRISRTTLRPGQTIYLANRDIAYQLTQS